MGYRKLHNVHLHHHGRNYDSFGRKAAVIYALLHRHGVWCLYAMVAVHYLVVLPRDGWISQAFCQHHRRQPLPVGVIPEEFVPRISGADAIIYVVRMGASAA